MMRRILLLSALSLAAVGSFAQSVTENAQQQLPVKRDSAAVLPLSIEPVATPVAPQGHDAVMTWDAGTDLTEKPVTYSQQQDKAPETKHFGVYAASSENLYPHLLDSRSAVFGLDYRRNGFHLNAGLVANKYETRTVTTQFGVNGLLEYRLSPHWSMAVFGSLYNSNPYFSMAAYPFVDTSEYGGWVRYEGEKVGIKIGTRRYYDSFQRQWRMEPIVTPSFKFGKNFVLELPVGPLVQKSMEKLLHKDHRGGAIIMPDFD